MRNKKNLQKVFALTLATATTASVFGMAGCGGKKTDSDQTLEVFVWEAGYGVEWCEDLLDAFEKEAWVKEKYPNLEIDFDSDGNKKTYTTKIDAGERGNTVDLFMTASLGNYVGKDASGYEFFADLTENVFNQTVPGESVTVKDKMLPTYLDSIRYYELGQDSNSENVPFKSYVFPWASGMDSILYNADHLDAMNLEVPLTTKQFVETCATIKAIGNGLNDFYSTPIDENGGYAILTDGGGNYWNYLYPVWWGQYEGVEEYYNFFNGVKNDTITSEVFEQKGKLYSLTTMENILKWENGYVYKKHTGLEYMQAQTNFLKGDAVFYSNGDWFANEMAETKQEVKEEYGIDYNIRMMRMPIVSEIIEKTPTIPNEETLREVIRAIDAGNATAAQANQVGQYDLIASVSEKDYATIMEARGIVHAIGSLHQAGVPSYAKGKEIAFDFLRYMATDKAQEIYMKATGGASLPFNYNLKEKNPALYNELFAGSNTLAVEQDRLSFIYDQCYTVNVLPDPGSFPLVKWGEMSDIHSLGGMSVVNYFIAKGSPADGKSVWEQDILYYCGAKNEAGIYEGGQFEQCRELAGIN